MNKFSLILVAMVLNMHVFAQAALKTIEEEKEATTHDFANTITADDLSKLLHVIASDEMEGRETGEDGQRKAADFIANYFDELGLPRKGENNTHFQSIAFRSESWNDISLTVNGKTYRHLWEYYSFPRMNGSTSIKTKEVLFLGYGVDAPAYSDYKGQDVKGKVLLIYSGEPMRADSTYWVSGDKTASEWAAAAKKLELAKAKGAAAVLILDPALIKNLAQYRKFLVSPTLKIDDGNRPEALLPANAYIASEIAQAILGKRMKKVIKARDRINKKGKARSVKLKTDLQLEMDKNVQSLKGSNVMGYIEGSDPVLKNEIVVLSAHYDHLGKRGEDIYNGADDNGSGTSTVMEIAEAFAKAKAAGLGPRRTVICMLVSGEEKGLLGSEYYVNNPVFPLENTVVDINIDMVGRVDDKYKDNPNYIYVIGSDRLSTDLHAINEQQNKEHTHLVLDYTYNSDSDPNRYYYRSDHYNFAQKGIPAIFYFNGTHDDYHRTTDTVDKINFDKMAIIAKLAFHVAVDIANRNERIKVDVEGRN